MYRHLQLEANKKNIEHIEKNYGVFIYFCFKKIENF